MTEKLEGPWTPFSWLYHRIKNTSLGQWFEFEKYDHIREHLGQYQFEALCFSILTAICISVFVIFSMGKYERFPGRIRNFLEATYEGLQNMITMLMGEKGSKFLPYLGTLFLYILVMNLLGIIPLFRSPTMVLSITGALGITTFFVVQYIGVKENGILGYVKHFMGPVIFLAPLMMPIELLGEIIKPVSLSVRLYGNISGEDTVIEKLIELGGFVPVQFPMLIFAIFTSFLQAFIFTALTSIYITILTEHKESH